MRNNYAVKYILFCRIYSLKCQEIVKHYFAIYIFNYVICYNRPISSGRKRAYIPCRKRDEAYLNTSGPIYM